MKTNECVMCGMSIPEDDVACKECAGYAVACVMPDGLTDADEQLLVDLEEAMYEAQDYDD